MGLIQTLITRYLLDPTGYKNGADVVAAQTSRLTGIIDRFKGGIVSGLSELLNPTKWVAGIGIGIGLVTLLGNQAVGAAIGFDTISRSLVAVTKDAERAKAILKFDDKLAGPSIFTSEDLAQASLTLEAFKLKTEQYLPVAEKLGTVFGQNTEALNSFVSALGYIKNGRFGEGFESFTRAGISREDLEGKGLKFDKGGSFVGSAEEALKAIEELVNERFGKLSEEMASGPAAKLASVMDAVGRAARVAGGAILTILMPAADKLGSFVAYLVDSGAIEKAISGITRLFSGEGIGDFLIEGVAWLVATLQNIPGIVTAIGNAFKGLFVWLRENLIKIGMVFVAIWAFDAVFAGMKMIHGAIKALQEAEKGLGIVAAVTQAIMTDGASLLVMASIAALAATGAAAIFAAAMPKLTDIPGVKGVGDVIGNIERDKNTIVSGFKLDSAKGPTGSASTIVDALINQLSPVKQIADNTKKTAAHTEKMANINDQILNGGTIGKGAGSAVNLGKALGSFNSGGDEADQIASLVRRMVQRVSGSAIVEAQYSARGGR